MDLATREASTVMFPVHLLGRPTSRCAFLCDATQSMAPDLSSPRLARHPCARVALPPPNAAPKKRRPATRPQTERARVTTRRLCGPRRRRRRRRPARAATGPPGAGVCAAGTSEVEGWGRGWDGVRGDLLGIRGGSEGSTRDPCLRGSLLALPGHPSGDGPPPSSGPTCPPTM